MKLRQILTSIIKHKYAVGKASSRNFSTGRSLAAIYDASTSDSERMVKIQWENKEVSRYPYIFLRDNCPCSVCLNPSSNTRSLDTVKDIDIDIKPALVQSEDNLLKCVWPDGHESVYEEHWLKERKFPESEEEIVQSTYDDLIPVHWGAELVHDMPSVEYDAFESCDVTLLNLLRFLGTHGFCIIKGAPVSPGVIHKMPERVSKGFFRTTHYGTVFEVENKPNPSNLAYTSGSLPLHVDLPYYRYQPGIQFLHCIVQSDEENCGESQFSDGFHAAQQIRDQNPDMYDVLTKVKFKFSDIGSDENGEFDLQYERPLIGLDLFNNVEGISFSAVQRSSFINAPVDLIYRSYEAFYLLQRTLHHPGNMMQFKMVPGDIVCFNNRRVLHGRTAYDPNTRRWLQGCYFDWDEILCKYRTVKRRLGIKPNFS